MNLSNTFTPSHFYIKFSIFSNSPFPKKMRGGFEVSDRKIWLHSLNKHKKEIKPNIDRLRLQFGWSYKTLLLQFKYTYFFSVTYYYQRNLNICKSHAVKRNYCLPLYLKKIKDNCMWPCSNFFLLFHIFFSIRSWIFYSEVSICPLTLYLTSNSETFDL